MQTHKFKNVEFSEVNFYELSGKMRIDSEHYQPEYINIEKQVRQKKHKPLGNFQTSIIHPTEIKREYEDEGVTFLRTQNVRPLNVDFGSSEVFISRTDANKLKALQYGDVLMTRTGANFGDTAVYLNQRERVIASSHVLLIRSVGLNQHYLGVFLNSKYGRKLIDKGMYGGLQPEIAPSYLYGLPIPIPSDAFQTRFEDLLLQAYKLQRQSEQLYENAEKLLINELGLGDWKPKTRLFNHAGVKIEVEDTVNAVGAVEMLFKNRLDSEFWQPKYVEVEEYLKNNGRYEPLGSVASLKKGLQARSDVNNDGKILFASIRDCQNLLLNPIETTDAERTIKVSPQSLVMAITGATIGKTAINLTGQSVAISGDLVSITSKTLPPFYLLAVLSSRLIKSLSVRYTTGATNGHLSVSDLLQFPIPLLDDDKMVSINSLVDQHYQDRARSQKLLTLAKQAVELYIEEDETAALALIESCL